MKYKRSHTHISKSPLKHDAIVDAYHLSLFFFFFFSSRRRHTRFDCDWSSDVCSSDLSATAGRRAGSGRPRHACLCRTRRGKGCRRLRGSSSHGTALPADSPAKFFRRDRKSTRLNSSHSQISYAVFCLKKKKNIEARAAAQKSAKFPFSNARSTSEMYKIS